MFLTILKKELLIYLRRKSELVSSLVFFILTILLFPFAVGVADGILGEVAYGTIWVATIFAVMLALPSLIEPDYTDGTLKQYQTMPVRLELIILAKSFAHWAAFCLPVILFTPIAALFFGLSFSAILLTVLTLLIGTPIFVFLGAMLTSLILDANRNKALLALLIIPVYIPVLIFGVSATQSFAAGDSELIISNLVILFGLLLLSIGGSIWVTAYALKADS